MEADQAEEGAWEIEFSRNGIKPRKTKVCDYFSWDYLKSELSEYTYTHNRENEAYAEYDNVAQYSDERVNNYRQNAMEVL